MSISNQQTLADSGANERPPMLEKGNYIPWESRFIRFLDNKLEDGEHMWNSIEKGPYKKPMIPNPDNPQEEIIEPLSKMTEGNKKQYIADVKVMNYLLQAIPNDIYNSVDACKNAKDMWEQIKRLMFGSDVTSHVRHSRLMDEFDRFVAKEGESLELVYERLTTLVNIMDFSYDVLYDSLLQLKPHVRVSKAKKGAKNHDPLALLAHSNAFSSQSHVNSSYSPQSYYVTHPSSIVDYEDEYQGKLQRDSQEDKLRTDGRVDIQTKNAGYGRNGNRNAGRQKKNQVFNLGNGNDDNNHIGHYACDCQKPRVCDAKYFREQMFLAMKDEAGSHLKDEENDFMLDNSYGEETMKELTAAVMLMARIQPADGNAETVPSYDAKDVSKVNASSKVHE
ncbi:hypothetical protein Tco_1457080 [Tanacetum coccineum]